MTGRHSDLAELPIFGPVDDPESVTVKRARPEPVINQPRASAPRQTAAREADDAQVDWGLARSFRQQAAKLLADQLPDRTVDPDRERELGRKIINRLLDEHVAAQVRGGAGAGLFTPTEQDALAQAVLLIVRAGAATAVGR